MDKGQKLIGLAVGILAVLLAIPATSYSVRAVSAWVFGVKGMVYYEAYLDPRAQNGRVRVDKLQVATPKDAEHYCKWVTDEFGPKGGERKKFVRECCDHKTPEKFVWNTLEKPRNRSWQGPHPAPKDASVRKSSIRQYCSVDKERCGTDSELRAVAPRKPIVGVFTKATGPVKADMGFGTILQADSETNFRFVPWQFEVQRPGFYEDIKADDRRKLRHLHGLASPKAKASVCFARHRRDREKCDYKAYPQKFVLRRESCVVVLSRAKDGIEPRFATEGAWFYAATTSCGFFR